MTTAYYSLLGYFEQIIKILLRNNKQKLKHLFLI